MSAAAPARRVKRSAAVAEAIRAWIVREGLGPGHALPIEREMIARFGVSRATMREALRELEVQGMVRVKTGPRGGPIVSGDGAREILSAIRTFCYFRGVSAQDIYALRTPLEVEAAISATGRLDAADLDRLAELVALSERPAEAPEERLAQREAEFEFHRLLAGRSPNPLLALMVDAIASILSKATSADSAAHARHADWSCENARHHARILSALRERDAPRVGMLMREHMDSACGHLALMHADPPCGAALPAGAEA